MATWQGATDNRGFQQGCRQLPEQLRDADPVDIPGTAMGFSRRGDVPPLEGEIEGIIVADDNVLF